MLPDLPEQFGPPDTAPPLLSRLMEAVESKGSRLQFCSVTSGWVCSLCFVHCVCPSGVDSPGLYRSLSGGALDTRQLTETGQDRTKYTKSFISVTFSFYGHHFEDFLIEKIEQRRFDFLDGNGHVKLMKVHSCFNKACFVDDFVTIVSF